MSLGHKRRMHDDGCLHTLHMQRPLVAMIAFLGLALYVLAAAPVFGDIQEDQEKIALRWVEMHNAADVDAMAAFRAKHFQRSKIVDWRTGYESLVQDFGTLKVYGVMIEGDGRLMIGVEPEKSEDRVRLVFEFFEDAPDQIRQVALDQGNGPGDSGSDLPSLELTGDWQQRKSELDRYLRDLADQGLFSGAVLIAHKNDVRFEKAYGLASREFSVPNNIETRFDVGSFNKDYTRVAIFQLAGQGKLSIKDTVGELLPDYPNEKVRRLVTIQQLLEHRSGLGDMFTEEYQNTPMSKLREIADYIPIWGPKPLLSEPGERKSYSNYGYTVLGAIIEQASGQSYSDYVVEHVFKPAKMMQSGFFDTDAIVPNVAVGYTHMSLDGQLDEPTKNIYLEPAKGGPWGKSYSTARDLYRFFEAMMNGNILAGDNNWLKGAWETGSLALAGGGPGLNAMLSLEDGLMVIVMANMDPPIAGDLAMRISTAVRR